MEKSISEQFEDIKLEICDKYCKFPDKYEDEELMWEEKCDSCVLEKL